MAIVSEARPRGAPRCAAPRGRMGPLTHTNPGPPQYLRYQGGRFGGKLGGSPRFGRETSTDMGGVLAPWHNQTQGQDPTRTLDTFSSSPGAPPPPPLAMPHKETAVRATLGSVTESIFGQEPELAASGIA